VFASEVKALLASGRISRRLNPAAVSAYLSLGWVPSPLTIIDGVNSLEPGSLASFQNGQLQIRRYWDLVFKEDNNLDEAQAVAPLREHLHEAVRLRLHSDVPVGAFISGGVDSSAMLSLMRESLTGKLRTFSLAFEQPEFNEGSRARVLADRFQTDHTECLITSQEILRELSFIVAAMDQPSVDGIGSYFASKIARSSGTVVALSDLGGDELFGGYSSFWLAPRILQLGRLADTRWENGKALEALLGWLPPDGRSRQIAALLRRAPFLEVAYLAAKGLFLDDATDRVLSERFVNGSAGFDPLVYLEDKGHGTSESLSNRICCLELRTDLHNQLLRDTDAMSMAHSLEVRAPFLDHPLVEFLAKVPSPVKFSSRPKHLLIQAMSGKLPVQPGGRINGPSNSPFGFWLKNEWRGLAEELLCGRTVMSVDLFDRHGLRRLWDDFLQNRISWSRVWAVLILQLWVRRHIDGEISLLPPGYQFVRRG
jgi:asparagine synthase (glutamine-hydrolysing)